MRKSVTDHALHIFFTKMENVSFYQEGIHYCAAHKCSIETIFNAPRPIKKFDQCCI